MTRRVILEDAAGAMVAYDESDEERDRRIATSGESAAAELQLTLSQIRRLRRARADARRSMRPGVA
jgi:hypothetical protein